MKHNVGTLDRWIRALVGLAMATFAFVLPLPTLGIAALGGTGALLVWTAAAGRCPGYRLLGMSSCPMSGGQ